MRRAAALGSRRRGDSRGPAARGSGGFSTTLLVENSLFPLLQPRDVDHRQAWRTLAQRGDGRPWSIRLCWAVGQPVGRPGTNRPETGFFRTAWLHATRQPAARGHRLARSPFRTASPTHQWPFTAERNQAGSLDPAPAPRPVMARWPKPARQDVLLVARGGVGFRRSEAGTTPAGRAGGSGRASGRELIGTCAANDRKRGASDTAVFVAGQTGGGDRNPYQDAPGSRCGRPLV